MVAGGWGRIVNVAGLAARGDRFDRGNDPQRRRRRARRRISPTSWALRGSTSPSSIRNPRSPSAKPPLAPAEGPSIGRLVTAAEVADVIAFLCSPAQRRDQRRRDRRRRSSRNGRSRRNPPVETKRGHSRQSRDATRRAAPARRAGAARGRAYDGDDVVSGTARSAEVRSDPAAGVYTVEWPSSQSMRYRGAGSLRSTSRTVPERAWRSVDSDSACTRSPTSNVIEILPSIAARRAYEFTRAVANRYCGHTLFRRRSQHAPVEKGSLSSNSGTSGVARSRLARRALRSPPPLVRVHRSGPRSGVAWIENRLARWA